MSDVGELEKGVLCPCGYRGDVLHLHGRVPTSRNILGTSISIFEFVRVLSVASEEQLTEADLQLIELDHEEKGMGLVLMISHRIGLSTDKVPEILNSSPLIKELISKSIYFRILITDKNDFLKSEITQKIKTFITAKKIPDIEN
ncbi:hypothetical protein [Mechercharimyces sp. CAU 1602]|uniref:hypothetical protein n=1 Tax=Mechercharimyces sp. CAU 1602 TaxID=2973933 RepID=UPI002163A377|nr:hypothetical protein [Mechercharimyces sp. CAU 1602]MCS1352609.1 hypothetical protein [Mechercharimyces sp. CAU 1602]